MTVLVLGAGTGGIIAAKKLSKKIGRNAKFLLFEKEEKNVFAPSLLWLMVGNRKPKQVYRNTKKIGGTGIEVIIGNIEKAIPEQISVSVNGKEYKGDYILISLGVEQIAEHNLNNFGLDFDTFDGATKFSKQIQNFKARIKQGRISGKIAVLVSDLPFKCPAAPYQAAMLIESFIRKIGLSTKTEVSLYVPEPGPMGVAGKELSGAVRQLLESKGVKYFPEHQLIADIEKSLTFSNGKTTEYDLLTFTLNNQCPAVIRETSLIGKSGWIEVDRNTRETKFQNVYAIGDITFIPLELGKPLPKAGVFTHYQDETVAHNIAQKIAGKSPDRTYMGTGNVSLNW